MAVISTQAFFNVNIVLLSAGPFLVGLLIYVAKSKQKLYWSKRGWGRFPAALVVSFVLTFGLGNLYMFINPFVRNLVFIGFSGSFKLLSTDHPFLGTVSVDLMPVGKLPGVLWITRANVVFPPYPSTAINCSSGIICFQLVLPLVRHYPHQRAAGRRPLLRHLHARGNIRSLDYRTTRGF